jgi:hypothetical protein
MPYKGVTQRCCHEIQMLTQKYFHKIKMRRISILARAILKNRFIN